MIWLVAGGTVIGNLGPSLDGKVAVVVGLLGNALPTSDFGSLLDIWSAVDETVT